MTVAEEIRYEDKKRIVKNLVKKGFGLPVAIKVYNQLSDNGAHDVDNAEFKKWLKENY